MGVKGEQAQGTFRPKAKLSCVTGINPGSRAAARTFAPEALRDVEYDAPQVDPVECKRRYDIEIIAHVLSRVVEVADEDYRCRIALLLRCAGDQSGRRTERSGRGPEKIID